MKLIEFLSTNNEYLILGLLFFVLSFILLQYMIDYIIIGRHFLVKSKQKLNNYDDIESIDGNGNVIDFESNKRFFPIEPKKLSINERIKNRNNFEPKNILNSSEQNFFRHLCEILTDCHVFPQVSFNALITHASWISRPHWQQLVRSKFNVKYVDFVACNKTDLKVLAVIEYDGRGHQSKRDHERDSLLTGVGYRVERFTHHDTPHSIRIRFGLLDQENTRQPHSNPTDVTVNGAGPLE